jgi:outer membrane protein TolC
VSAFVTSIFLTNLCLAQENFDRAEGLTPTETTMEYKGPRDQSVNLSLKEAIEKGLRLNPKEQIRNFKFSKLDLQLDANWDQFWLPNITLELNTDNQNLDRLKTVTPRGPIQNNSTRAPQGMMGLSFGEYSLFNWGRDYLKYVNNYQLYNQEKWNLGIERRRLKFRIIDQFSNLSRWKKVLKIKSDQLRNTSFVYRLAREKAALKKIKKQEYYETRTEFLRAQNEYHLTKSMVYEEEAKLANLIGDSSRPSYNLTEGIRFETLKYPLKDALEQSLKSNPDIVNFKQKMDNAGRSYHLAKKETMPLPKVSVNLGTYTKTLGTNGSQTYFETHNGNSNIEVVASINFTIDLVGENGFLNHRQRQHAYLNKRISEVRYFNSKRESEVEIRKIYRQIRQLERLYKVSELKVVNTRKGFDETLNNYLERKQPFINLRRQLINYIRAVEEFEQIKYQHLTKKLTLADLVGRDDFPAESFENLARRQEKL